MNSVNLPVLLEKNLSERDRNLLAHVRRIAEAERLRVYLVGGFVRELLLGHVPHDFDFVVEGDAPVFAHKMARLLGGDVTVYAPFGTVTWVGPEGVAIDFAAARTETYPQPAALPQVTPGASIAADLGRRDFTINAIALRVDGEHFGELLDPHGGQADLAARLVRVLHSRSFIDDPTRLFRAVRYEQRLGFTITPDTLALIPGAWESLATLTGDRIRHEFELIFREPQAVVMLARLDELEILRHVHPVLRWSAEASRRAEAIPTLPPSDWRLASPPEPDALYYALLLEEVSSVEAAESLTRLNVNHTVFEAVQQAIDLKLTWTCPSEAVAVLDGLSELGVIAAYVLKEENRSALNDYLARWRFVRAETTGDDLIARGLTPGPRFKQILWKLRAAWLDGEVSDRAGERDLLRRLLAEVESIHD